MMRSLLARMSPAGPGARLPILIFHRVRPVRDELAPGEIDAAQFDRVCGWLAHWFNVVPLDTAARHLREGTLPERALAITFDDGYADNHDVALPILLRHGLSATFFIATGFLDGGRMWNDTVIETVRRPRGASIVLETVGAPGRLSVAVETTEQKRQAIDTLLPAIKHLPAEARMAAVQQVAAQAGGALPDDLMLTTPQLLALSDAGMQIGAHTVTHPILAVLDRPTARAEMLESKLHLERLLKSRVTLFAYPNGRPSADYDAKAVALARELGYSTAVTTARGAADIESDPLQLPRIATWDRGRLKFGLRLAATLYRGRPGAPRLRSEPVT